MLTTKGCELEVTYDKLIHDFAIQKDSAAKARIHVSLLLISCLHIYICIVDS